jgi:hypothetical protein
LTININGELFVERSGRSRIGTCNHQLLVWDKVFGLGTTDPITGMIADWTGLIVTAYVGGRSIEGRGG